MADDHAWIDVAGMRSVPALHFRPVSSQPVKVDRDALVVSMAYDVTVDVDFNVDADEDVVYCCR